MARPDPVRPVLGLLLLLPLPACLDVEASEPAPCVLVVTVDGLTAAPAGSTPRLDDLAARSVRFERAWLPNGDLRASAAALWSGHGPDRTGVLDEDDALPPDLPGLVAALYAQDQWTGAVASVPPLARAAGLERGFEHYDGKLHTTPEAALAAARARVDERAAFPGGWFLWVHLPAAEPAAVDAALGGLLDRMAEGGLGPRTTVVVADLTGVPEGPGRRGLLLLHRPGHRPFVCADDVTLVDVLPTLTECLELAPEEELPNEGRSLAPALFGLPVERAPLVVRDAAGARHWIAGGWSLGPDDSIRALAPHESAEPEPERAAALRAVRDAATAAQTGSGSGS